MDKKTEELMEILGSTHPEQMEAYLEDCKEELFSQERPFAAYMRQTLARHGVTQQSVFLKAGMSQRYGYRLISEEKRTRRRDYILRLCIAGELTLEEVQRALQLYGMSPLYARIPRDALLIAALNQEKYDLQEVNRLLECKGMEPLQGLEGEKQP